MKRKIEVIELALNAVMREMSTGEKLVFLTDIFCLTEDIRYDISESDTAQNPVLRNKAMVIPSGTIEDEDDSCDREKGSNVDHVEISE